jgi:hypothetical protein
MIVCTATPEIIVSLKIVRLNADVPGQVTDGCNIRPIGLGHALFVAPVNRIFAVIFLGCGISHALIVEKITDMVEENVETRVPAQLVKTNCPVSNSLVLTSSAVMAGCSLSVAQMSIGSYAKNEPTIG